MISPEHHDAEHLLARLASTDWRARQEALEALEQWDGPSLARALVKVVRKDPGDLSALSGALDALERIGRSVHGAISGELIALLDDPDADMRMVAPLVLGQIGDTSAVPALLRMAQRAKEEENARFNAIEALGKLGDPSAVPKLRQLATEEVPYLRYAAVLALGQSGSQEAADDLLPLLDDDYLAEPAVTALAQIGSERAVPEIVHWIERRIAVGVCELPIAARALAAIARRAENSDYVREAFLPVSPRLRACLLEQTACEQCPASDLIWADLALLTAWMARQNPSDKELRAALIGMLAYPPARPEVEAAVIAEPNLAQQELVDLLDETDPIQAQFAVRMLGQARAAFAVPELVRVLESGDDALAAPAAESLGRIGTPDTVEPLLSALGSPSIQVRQSAIGALAVNGDTRVKERLADLFADPEPEMRESALQLAALLDDRLAAEHIIKAMEDPEISVQKAAVEILPRLKDPRAFGLLEQALRSPDETLRSAAVRACTTMEPDRVRPFLITAAGDANPWVRMHAVRALGMHPKIELLPLYGERLRDPLAPVRAAAVEALARLPRETSATLIQAALEDENEDVRQAARRALESTIQPPNEGGQAQPLL